MSYHSISVSTSLTKRTSSRTIANRSISVQQILNITSHFVLPTSCSNLYIAQLVLIITSQFSPSTVLTSLFNDIEPYCSNDDFLSPGAFIYRLAKAVEHLDLASIVSLINKLSNNLHNSFLQHQLTRNSILCWTFDMNTESPNSESVGFSLFEFQNEMGFTYHCTDCGTSFYTNTLLRDAMFRFNHIPLQEFIIPVSGSKWSSADIALRIGKDPMTYRCSNCQSSGYFVWDRVQTTFGPKYPLLVLMKRYIPEVDSVEFGSGTLKEQLPKTIQIGCALYYYSGYTARIGHIGNFVYIYYFIITFSDDTISENIHR